MKKIISLIFVAAALVANAMYAMDVMDLAGTWQFALDRDATFSPGKVMTDNILLPGTTDTNHKGDVLTDKSETTHLSRPYFYKGRAWYRRTVDIPSEWRGKPVYLSLERTKPSQVYVDGVFAGSSNDISTPQEYNLGKWLTPGRHVIDIMVDNGSGVPEQIYASSHAYTEDTQTNWNGIIGKITLSTEPFTASPIDDVHPSLRDFHTEGRNFYANGKRVFLRGRHDACVWPLTGHVAMDIDSWRKYMKICQDYGLNHVRFHSWCPPEAAFQAADEAGIVLQPELPFWGSFDKNDSTLMTFLHKEGMNILRRYGHHPSFRLFALGNELWGDIDAMKKFVDDFKAIAPDKLYTFGSNYYLGYHGVKPGMDFFVTCRVGGEGWGNFNTHTRGSFSFADALDGGMINHFRPNATMNFEEGCLLSPVPVISHEAAQFQTYPDYSEIDKYIGVLAPYNLEVFRSRLENAGMADQASDFRRASGQWSLRLYKQDIEMDLRTPDMAGFQLLDLQDYPGQGSAYVGILDAFLDSKNLCTPEQWREWCSPVVPLLVADSYCYTTSDTIKAALQLADYGSEPLKGKTLHWQLQDVGSGNLPVPDDEGLIDVGKIQIPLAEVKAPRKLRLDLAVDSTQWHNGYDIWVYPENVDLAKLRGGIIVTHELTPEIERRLDKGAKVLWMPDTSSLTVGPLFQTDYWNYRMFKTICEKNKREVSPGTLGILADPAHPLLKEFPNDGHSDWQWWAVVRNSHPFMLDNTSAEYRPVVQAIDNIERNHKLGLAFEFTVGKGKLLVVMSDLDRASEYPEGRQFYASVLSYMNTSDFKPDTKISLTELHKLFTTPVTEGKIGVLDNISPY